MAISVKRCKLKSAMKTLQRGVKRDSITVKDPALSSGIVFLNVFQWSF